MTHATFERWLEVWENILPFADAAFETIMAQPELIRLPEINAAWAQLRAALS